MSWRCTFGPNTVAAREATVNRTRLATSWWLCTIEDLFHDSWKVLAETRHQTFGLQPLLRLGQHIILHQCKRCNASAVASARSTQLDSCFSFFPETERRNDLRSSRPFAIPTEPLCVLARGDLVSLFTCLIDLVFDKNSRSGEPCNFQIYIHRVQKHFRELNKSRDYPKNL